MTARTETLALIIRLARRGINADFDAANTLRRAQITLHRWAELECGDSNDFASWCIVRDEQTGIPYHCVYPHAGPIANNKRYRIADKEAGALRRVRHICVYLKIDFYHQTDPRGCALYVSAEPINDTNYTNGVAVCS